MYLTFRSVKSESLSLTNVWWLYVTLFHTLQYRSFPSGVDPGGGIRPPIFGLGDTITNVPSNIRGIITYRDFSSMQHFRDRFFSRGVNLLGGASRNVCVGRDINFCIVPQTWVGMPATWDMPTIPNIRSIIWLQICSAQCTRIASRQLEN